MKRYIKVVAICMIITILMLPGVAKAEDSMVDIPDNNLKQALLTTGVDTNGDGKIAESEIGALTGELNLSNKGIVNLSGLEYAINITGLYLDKNSSLKSIANLSPLSKLKVLSLVSTGVSDLSVVTNFQSLNYLDISKSSIVNLNSISGLTSLETLLLNQTNVSSIVPVQNMTNLKKLSLSGTKVRDITALASLTNLTYLDISYDYLAENSISKLEPLTNLEYLNIENNLFFDSTPLKDMHNLKELNAAYCKFTSIDSLSSMYNLEKLDLRYCNITDIHVLADKTNLEEINILYNYLNPHDADGDMAVLTGIDKVVGANDQHMLEITYDGGLYGTPERSYDDIYHGDAVVLPRLTFNGSFHMDGWDINGDGLADISEGASYIVEPSFVRNYYNVTYHAIYTRNYSWPSGSGTEQDPYLVSTPEQVNEIRYSPNACFKLINDIDMTAITKRDGVLFNDGAGWDPIFEFNGVLDGGGHAICGLSSYRVETSFIATISESAEIRNLTLSNVHFEGEDCVCGIANKNNGTMTNCSISGYLAKITNRISTGNGGIAGINNGTISLCKSLGTISALDEGELVGGIAGLNKGLIECSINSATVKAMRTSGGIAGVNAATIRKCYNTGYIDGKECGGIVSDSYLGSIISDCYNIGHESESKGGGIADKSAGTIINCYNIGSVQGKSIINDIYGGTVTNCYAIERANEIIEPNSGASNVLSLTNEQMHKQTSFSGFDFNGTWTMSGNPDYPYPELQQVAMTVLPDNTVEFAGGNGLPYNPYRIVTAAHLNNVRNYAWDWFEMQNDLDLSAATRAGGDYYNNGQGWIPLGENDSFYGVFDGNCHIITGLRIDSSDDVGLFANCTESSTIKDLGVARAVIRSNGKAGIIATSTAGDLYRCYTSGEVYGDLTGGLVVDNRGSISDCYSTASVFGVGGLAYANSGKITRCYNVGNGEGSCDIAPGSGSLGEGCYHLANCKSASNNVASNPGIELTEQEFTKQDSFDCFDFDTVWTMAGDPEYPYPELSGLVHIEMPENTVEFAGGNGLPYAPYLISNSTHLNNMRNYNTNNFELLADIDLGGSSWEPFPFYGNFKGNHHIVSDANIIADDWYVGFFTSANYSTITDFGIRNFNLVSKLNTETGSIDDYIGLFAGKLYYCRITNCYATGSINCVRGTYIGGFAGLSNSKITDCYANVNIIGDKDIGGFIGFLEDYTSNTIPEEFSEVKSSYSIGEINGKHVVGGFIGYAHGKIAISDCYSDGKAIGTDTIGGFVGITDGIGSTSNCYSLCDVGGTQTIGAFVGNSDPNFSYDNCYWYSNSGANPIGSGSTAIISKISIPEIDDIDINEPVDQSELTTNFNLNGSPIGIEFIGTSDPSVVKIQNAQIKGISLGNAQVSLLFKFTNEQSVRLDGYQTSITGIPQIIFPVTGVSLNPSELYIHKNDIATLSAAVSPENATNKNLVWKSGNENVVSVNEHGIITAKQAGYATVSVTTEDGEFSASCSVFVDTPTAVHITSGILYCWPREYRVSTATVLPSSAENKNIIWSSSDESIAEVGRTTGIVQAIAPGTATITAKTEVGDFTDSTYIYVKQPVTGVEVDPETVRVNVGNLYNLLNVHVLPDNAYNKRFSYSSSNSNIASVDPNGYIRGIQQGTATITVESEDGGFIDTCKVTVIQPVEKVAINGNPAEIHKGDHFALSATILPEDATNRSVIWTSSDETIATIDQNGRITALKPGDAIITATADGVLNACNIHVSETYYTVSFETNGGNTIASKSIIQNATIEPPAEPQKAGYAFKGWYKEGSLVHAWNFTTDHATSNVTLYAKWTLNTYTVVFNTQGGSQVNPAVAPYNTTIAAPAAPSRAGYVFGGWYRDAACTVAWNFTSDAITSDITLYAKWGSNQTVAVQSSNAKYGTASGGSTYGYGLPATVTALPKNGYCFTKWTEGKSVVSYDPIYTFTVSGNRTLKANFAVIGTPSVRVKATGA